MNLSLLQATPGSPAGIGETMAAGATRGQATDDLAAAFRSLVDALANGQPASRGSNLSSIGGIDGAASETTDADSVDAAALPIAAQPATEAAFLSPAAELVENGIAGESWPGMARGVHPPAPDNAADEHLEDADKKDAEGAVPGPLMAVVDTVAADMKSQTPVTWTLGTRANDSGTTDDGSESRTSSLDSSIASTFTAKPSTEQAQDIAARVRERHNTKSEPTDRATFSSRLKGIVDQDANPSGTESPAGSTAPLSKTPIDQPVEGLDVPDDAKQAVAAKAAAASDLSPARFATKAQAKTDAAAAMSVPNDPASTGEVRAKQETASFATSPAPAREGGHAAAASVLYAAAPTPSGAAAPAISHAGPAISVSGRELLPEDTAAQLVQAIRLIATRGGGEAQIRLEPQHFGEVTISIKVDQGQVVARVQAESAAVREWLQSNHALLKDGLAEQKLTLDRFEVHEPKEFRESERRDERSAQEERQSRRQRPPQVDAPFEPFEVVV